MIELKVEEYCHDCPEFDPVYDKTTAYDGKMLTCTVTCSNARKCAAIKKHLEGVKPKEEPTTPVRIKSRDTCAECEFSTGNLCGTFISVGCKECPNTTDSGGCHCNLLNWGDPCPYYKEAKDET